MSIPSVKVLLSLLSLPLLLAGQDQELAILANSSRPATKSDVVGVWEMPYQHISAEAKTTGEAQARFQVFAFYEDGSVKRLTATKRISPEERLLLLSVVPEMGTWEMIGEGRIVIRRAALDVDNIRAAIVERSFQDPFLTQAPPYREGDLVLTYLDLERKPVITRLLRRAAEDGT
ncbi:MAG: hypothetical protein AAGA45_00380 [Verrucomicrobiota bacterium]